MPAARPSKAELAHVDPLPRSFYSQPGLTVARQLLGARLLRREHNGQHTSGLITETEAYIGQEDLACHARHGKTRRNEVMWGQPGYSYVYFTYGMHWLLNAVAEPEGFPAAVLIRAVEPEAGLRRMRRRRGSRPDNILADGPAKLCQAFALDGAHNQLDLCDPASMLTIVPGRGVPDEAVTAGPRVGLYSVPEPWVSKPWRLLVRSDWFSELAMSEGAA
jgi:DNA-3-methyladenine glycosylase